MLKLTLYIIFCYITLHLIYKIAINIYIISLKNILCNKISNYLYKRV